MSKSDITDKLAVEQVERHLRDFSNEYSDLMNQWFDGVIDEEQLRKLLDVLERKYARIITEGLPHERR